MITQLIAATLAAHVSVIEAQELIAVAQAIMLAQSPIVEVAEESSSPVTIRSGCFLASGLTVTIGQ
jgi:hypothetical protein